MIKKQKIDTRTYDDDGFKKRAGCICFKDDSEQEVSTLGFSLAESSVQLFYFS